MDIKGTQSFSNPFWDFAVRVYGRDAVREACLSLQDTFGADVNVLLFLCWRAINGTAPVEADELDQMLAAIEPVRSTAILPLRAVRIALRTPLPDDVPALREMARQRVMEAEISAEAVAQSVLQQRFFTAPASPPPENWANGWIADALKVYIMRLGGDPDVASARARDLVTAIADGCE